MTLVLRNADFVNNKLYVSYGTRQQALFTIVNESFPGLNTLGTIDVITCIIRRLDVAGAVLSASLGSMIIGLGDGDVKVTSSVTSLRGQVMKQSTMEQCIVSLTED